MESVVHEEPRRVCSALQHGPSYFCSCSSRRKAIRAARPSPGVVEGQVKVTFGSGCFQLTRIARLQNSA